MTSHRKAITDFRFIADTYDRIYDVTAKEDFRLEALAARAAADLLEIHDATGINLHQAPNLLAWVEALAPTLIGPLTVEDNGV